MNTRSALRVLALVGVALYDFKSNPDVFGRFDSSRQSATPVEAPKRAPVVFLR